MDRIIDLGRRGNGMIHTVTAIEAEARKLSPSARFSLDEPDRELDRLWSQEAEERLAAYRRGEMKGIP